MTAGFQRRVPATPADLAILLDGIQAWLAAVPVGGTERARLMTVFDELLSNIVLHGGGTIDIDIELAEGSLRAAITDDGPPFDPLDRAVPDTAISLDDRSVGGLGIHLVRHLVDGLGYTRDAGRNRLTFRKTIDGLDRLPFDRG